MSQYGTYRRVSSVASTLILSLVLLLAVGCKKAPDNAANAPAKKGVGQKASMPQPLGEGKTPQLDEQAPSKASPESESAQVDEPEAAGVDKKNPSKLIEAPPSLTRADGDTDDSTRVPAAPAVDPERLTEVFIALWCAELGGANADELHKLYQTFNYPPLENWYGVWHSALMDSNWARVTTAKAMSKCGHLMKAEDPTGEKALPTPEVPGAKATEEKKPAPADDKKPVPVDEKKPAVEQPVAPAPANPTPETKEGEDGSKPSA